MLFRFSLLQVQVLPPGVFWQVALALQPPLSVAHSSTSAQVLPSPLKPALQAHCAGPPATLLQAALGLARWSSHPLSQALASHPRAAEVPSTTEWDGVREVPGQGMSALDSTGREWRLGSRNWVTGTAVPEIGRAHV